MGLGVVVQAASATASRASKAQRSQAMPPANPRGVVATAAVTG
jgi:hypothetical protein